MKLRNITKTHGGRILLAAVPAVAAATLVTAGVAQGAVPVSFSISGSQFKLSADSLDGTGFSQYAGVATDSAGVEHAVISANIGQAEIVNLCQSVVTETPLGTVGVMITAGGGGAPVTATGLQIGMSDLQGDASFSNIRIGVDGSAVSTDIKGGAGDFAQDSDTIHIDGLRQTAWLTQAAVFELKGMHVQITGGDECF
ncbi:MAG: cholesterol esterase [Microbacteriaceae bacterium]|nr:cholesterol esterase [Microbacteriaceae bacterium]